MYLSLKLLHIASVIIFLGNIITGLFWHAHAERTRDAKVIAHAVAGIIRSDRMFTVPGVVLIIGSGVLLAVSGGFPLLRTGWILWTLVAFAISGIAFMARVAPLQRQLLVHASAGVSIGSFDYSQYHKLALRWEFWGAVAVLTPIAGLVLMVFKPAI